MGGVCIMLGNESYSVRREIKKAVMDLMAVKSYIDITVTDIVNKAQVARASFYRNYNSIYDVIESIAEEIVNDFVEDVIPVLSGGDERRYRDFLFNYFYGLKKLQKNTLPLRFENLSVLFTELDKKADRKIRTLPAETLKDKYGAVGKIGLINSITKKWLDSGTKETPEEMVDYIMSFIMSF